MEAAMLVPQVTQSRVFTSIQPHNSVGAPSTKEWRSVLRVSLSFVVAVAFVACAGETIQEPPTVASVVVTPGSATLVSLGETVQLTASARDGDGNPISGHTFTWVSSSQGVASVSASGLVSAVDNGSATITATTGSVSGSASVSVAQVASSVAVTPATATLVSLGETVQLTASAQDASGNAISGKTFTWSSSDESVIEVSSSGLVIAAGPNGSATITATTDGVNGTVMVDVVTDPVGGTVSAAGGQVTLVFPPGAVTQQITVTVDPAASTPPNTRFVASTAFEFGPAGTRFGSAAGLTIQYDPGDVPAGVMENDLRLHTVVSGSWGEVPGSSVDLVGKSITGQIDGFSTYGVMGASATELLEYCTTAPAIPVCASLRIVASLNGEGGTDVAVWLRNLQGDPDLPGVNDPAAMNTPFWLIEGNPAGLQPSASAPPADDVDGEDLLDGAVLIGTPDGPWGSAVDYRDGVATVIQTHTHGGGAAVVGCLPPTDPATTWNHMGVYQTCDGGWVVVRFSTDFEWDASEIVAAGFISRVEQSGTLASSRICVNRVDQTATLPPAFAGLTCEWLPAP
jgi:uncharacterized protein YjdB